MSLGFTVIARSDGHGLNDLIRNAIGNVDEICICYDAEGPQPSISAGVTPVRRFYRNLNNDYGAQRNFLIDNCNCDWQFSLDTDETIPVDLWHKLRSLTGLASELIAFPRANIFTNVCERLCWPDYQGRLARKHIRWVGDLHEAHDRSFNPLLLKCDDETAIRHEKTATEQRKAIVHYNSIRPIKQAILVFEWNRPHYLKVCLDSLYRCAGIESWPILLSVDGPGLDKFSDEVQRARHLIPWEDHAGNLWHVTRSLAYCFEELGLDRVLFMDGDCIVRRDTLTNLPASNGEHLFVGFEKGDGPRDWLIPYCNLIEREPALRMLEWVRAMKWVGKQRPGFSTELTNDYPGFDAVFCRYLQDHQLKTLFREKSYAAHIGVCGLDCHDPHLEKQIFKDDPAQWLDNAIKLHATVRHPSIVPVDFRYED